MKMSRRTLVALSCTALLPACGTEQAAEAHILSTGKVPSLSTTVAGWSFRHAAAVGGADAPPAALLNGVIGDVVEDADGRFYVLNFGDKRLLAFDRLGRHLWSAGKPGRGPGEFQVPAAAAVAGGALYVLDPQSGGLSQFHRATGAYQRSVPLERGLGYPMDLKSGDGRTLLVKFEPVQGMRGGSRPRVMRVAVPGGRATPLAQLDTLVQVTVAARQGEQRMTRLVEPPFSPQPAWAAAADGSMLYGNGARYEVFRATEQGPRLAFRAAGAAQRVSAADRAAYLRANPVLSQAGVPVRFPETKPFYTDLRADPRGLVWLALPTSAEQQVWEVRDSSGRKLGEVRTPARTRIVGISATSIYLVHLDDDDVETVYRFTRQAQGG